MAPKSNDKVLFVAVNNSAAHRSTQEFEALKARGVDVQVVKDAKVDDQVGGFDLGKPEGALAFALTVGLPGEQTRKVARRRGPRRQR